jgi:hypothetical protein
VAAGLDVEMPFAQQRAVALRAALATGAITRAEISVPAIRVVATLLRFASLITAPRPDHHVMAAREHRALARRAAAESVVLLTNRDELIPADPHQVRRLAVLGRLAAVANLGDGGSSAVHPPAVVTPLDGLRAGFARAEVRHHDTDASIARDADLAVVVVGYTKADEGEYVDGTDESLFALFPPMDDPRVGRDAPVPHHPAAPPALPLAPDEARMATGGDRRSLRLSADDEALIAAAVAANPRTVVLVMGGSAVVMPWIDAPAATLLVWYPGMEGGDAIADVLTGAVPPGGHLPFAIPTAEADLVHFDPDATTETYGGLHGQWHLDQAGIPAAFPFGFGLSTTELAVTGLHVADDAASASATVANTGRRDGVAVVQVYAAYEVSAYDRPAWRLVGFRRVAVAAGETRHVVVPLDLSMLDVRAGGAMVREPGTVVLRAGLFAGDEGPRVEIIV